MDYAVVGVGLLLGGVFVVSSLGKLVAFNAFLVSVRELTGLPRAWLGPVGIGVLTVEAGIPVLLITFPVTGFAVAFALLLGFSAAIALALRRGEAPPCRCFGSGAPVNESHLVRNGLLMSASLVGVLGRPWSLGDLHPAGVAVTVVAAGVGCLLIVFFDDLVALVRWPA